jgi:hypothetical protein
MNTAASKSSGFINSRVRNAQFLLALLFLLPIFSAQAEQKHVQQSEEILLGLVGYNYTNRDIESYAVSGIDGGNVRRSSRTSGGSGVACCINPLSLKSQNFEVKIRWQVDGCIYILRNDITGATQKLRHLNYKEALVRVEDLSKGRPRYLETHIYKNGSVRARLTQEISLPLIQLDEGRPDQSSFLRCKDDKRPE